LSGAYLLRNAVSYDGEILHADAYRPCAKSSAGFKYPYIGRRYQKNDFFFKKLTCLGPQFCSVDRSVGWLAGCSQGRPCPSLQGLCY